MPSTQSRVELLTPYDPELSKTLRKKENQGGNNNPIIEEHEDGAALRERNPPEPSLRDTYRVDLNTVE